MRDLITSDLVPTFERLLDRSQLLNLARQNETSWGLRIPPQVYRALLVEAGPSAELDDLLLATRSGDLGDERFLAWAAARLIDGPTWQTLAACAVVTPETLDP